MSSQASKQSSGKSPLTIQRRFALGIVATFLVAGLGVWALSPGDPPSQPLVQNSAERQPLGLMTTLPIYWGEAAGMDELIAGTAEPHWVRGTLESAYDLVPLDSLAGTEGLNASEDMKHLLLAQPRPLSGAENVALDEWVRRGGRLLLFADPLLTGHSHFSIGDRRRPQDVILLSPILTRWGLSLQFDEAQNSGERAVTIGEIALPVNLAGTFEIVSPAADAPAHCLVLAEGVAAECTIGEGSALIIADADVLDQEMPGSPRETALRELTNRAFSAR